MTIYFEGNGESKPVTVMKARDQFIYAITASRDEALSDPYLESYQDSAQRDLVVANKIIRGVLSVLDGDSQYFPAMNLIPYVPDEDVEEAKAAGADFFDSGSGDIGQGLADYWDLVNS